MKLKILLTVLIITGGLLLSAQAQNQNPVASDTSKKCKMIYPTKGTINKTHGEGPFKVDLKTLKKKNNQEEQNVYHNEQDNFSRPDSIPYHPAPINTDTLKRQSNSYNIEEMQSPNSIETNPSVTFGFDANWCGQNTPPDNALAVSNAGYILSAINCRLDIYNSSGDPLSNIDYQTFFNTSSNKFSDPRLIYDQYSDRFIFFIQYGSTSSESRIYIAFSASNDPTQIWHYYYFNIGTTNGLTPGFWFDYPSVGINQSDFCVTGNIFDNSGTFSENLLMLINKQDGYNGVSYSNLHWLGWTNVTDGNGSVGFTIVPATAGQSISYDNFFQLVSTLAGGGSYITKYTINGNATNTNSTISSTKINTLQPYYPNSTATQPSGISLANNKAGCRIQCAVYLNGIISFVFTGNYNTGGYDYNSLYYNRITISNNMLNQSWSYLSGSNYNYPSVASFGINSVDLAAILCFLKSDASTKPEIRFKYFDNEMNQLSSSQARSGEASVNYSWTSTQRWGDYTATQRKYNATKPEIWLSGSYGNSSNYWQTSIAQITGYPGNVNVSEVNFNNEELIVYPNPVVSQLYIKGDFSKIKKFPELYNFEGNLLNIDVTRKDNEMFQLDVSRLIKGIYFVRFENSQSIKFVKE